MSGYTLECVVTYTTGSCRDDQKVKLHHTFVADNLVAAKYSARTFARGLCHEYQVFTDCIVRAKLFRAGSKEPLWRVKIDPDKTLWDGQIVEEQLAA
jgi:hypothetical protein